MLTSTFDFLESLFHTVFNRTVENFHTTFISGRRRNLNWRENCYREQNFRFRAQKTFAPSSNTYDSSLFFQFLRS
jgi:hypothetical protein